MIMFLAVMKISFMLGMIGNEPEYKPGETSRPVLVEAGLALAQEEQKSDPEPASSEQEVNVGDELMRLRQREEDLDRRERNLRMLEQEIDEKLEELERLEASLGQMLEEADVLKDQKIKHLVDVYANMKPQQAAQVLETLDESIAVKILAGMRGRQAGDILTNVDSQKAARLSELLTEMQTPFIE